MVQTIQKQTASYTLSIRIRSTLKYSAILNSSSLSMDMSIFQIVSIFSPCTRDYTCFCRYKCPILSPVTCMSGGCWCKSHCLVRHPEALDGSVVAVETATTFVGQILLQKQIAKGEKSCLLLSLFKLGIRARFSL